METLGEDLLLLAVRPNGMVGVATKLRFGLSGSELVRLAAARRVDIVRGRIVILDAAPTGDAMLDAALQSMRGRRREPTAKAWVASQRPRLVQLYLDRLVAAGTLRAERHKVLGVFSATRWVVVDTARLAAVRAKLDAIASGSGSLGSEQAAFAGLASAVGLALLLYPGRAGSGARKNLKNAAKRDRPAGHAAHAVADAADATSAAVDAAIRAATDAAVDASIDAATQAAISAATEAVHHAAANHGGGAAGGHH
ncbi:MAG TPA: GPP34 family phosphoprotein [Streptosporangiaceae bacterium]|nr:GPP34 family phosphoprotein [Streptosporangiaceae bacterium]